LRKCVSDGEQMVGNTLHGGNNHGDARLASGGADKTCGMKHAIRTQQRAAAKLQGDAILTLLLNPAGVAHHIGGAAFCF